MKKTTITTTIAAMLLGASGLIAQTANTAYTKPSGFVSLGNTASEATYAVPANTDVVISIPLHQAEERGFKVTASTSSALTVEGALVAGEFLPPTGAPYCLAITSGSQEGLMAVITGNTTTEIQATVANGGDLANVEADATGIIFKCWTLKTLFPEDLPVGTRVLAFSGVSAGENIAADSLFVYSGTQWLQLLGGSGVADDVVIHPGESVIVRAAGSPIPSLVITGVVPTFNHRFPIAKLEAAVGQDTRIGYFGGVGDTIGQSGLGFSPGDRLLSYDNEAVGINKSPDEVLVYNGSAWIGLLGVTGDQNAYKLKSGKGYVYRRVAAAAAGDVQWTDEQTYRPALQAP